MKTLTEKEALTRLAGYCSTAEHCRAEAFEKLKKWGLDPDEIDRILQTLEKEKYIDEERYCRSFVNDKYRFNKWGKVKIAQALYMKKLPSDLIWRNLNDIDEDEYLGVLRAQLISKRKSIRAKDEYELNAKLIRFAMSRGFEMKDIRRCLVVPDDMELADE